MFRERLTAVTVSVGCGDFLRETAPFNAQHFDQWVIVTSPRDEETREIARQHRATCLVTEDVSRDGPFSKGRMIERGLQMLPADTYVLHLDADIVLPSLFRFQLERAHLKPETIYGCDRYMVRSWEKWQKLKHSGWLQHSHVGHPHSVGPPYGYEIGSRWAGQDGYVPIGFFQLWNRLGGGEEWRGARMKPYPFSHGNACRSDVQQGLFFDRRQRELIPELFVAHLESAATPNGANWNGRKTPRFGPEYRPHTGPCESS